MENLTQTPMENQTPPNQMENSPDKTTNEEPGRIFSTPKVMNVNNNLSNGSEPCRRLSFENGDKIDDIHARIPKELIPEENMEFETEADARSFYLLYAKHAGFGTRIGPNNKDPKDKKKILDQIYYCCRQGQRPDDVRNATVKKHRPLTRCNCKAEMKVSCRRLLTKWEVVKFHAQHNHECVTPSKAHMFASHRKINNDQRNDIDAAISSGITPSQTVELMSKQVGGREHLGYTYEDCKNYLRTKRMKEMSLSDTAGVLEYLQRKQAEDPNFLCAVQVDIDGLITNIFWADAKMRSDYSHFGDVVSFDTTYRKHKDGRPIALFVGVNNHKQSIIFGAALLYDETAETFMWLFDTFVAAMSGKKPQTILTDQDAAMKKALEREEWRETFHRLCVWHINKNAAIHLHHVFEEYTDFKQALSRCMYDFDEEDEFINAWNDMLEYYKLKENTWLDELFKIRKKWALVYGKHTFCAEMNTTQRSESMNNTVKKYINHKYGLLEFFEHFERLLKEIRYKESRKDFSTSQSKPALPFPVQILEHAATVYTHKIFELFQVQVCKSHDSEVVFISENGSISEFNVKSFRGKYHHVTYAATDHSVNCGCKKFEFAGILCSHALAVLQCKKIYEIPHQYIKKRWMKTAKRPVKILSKDMSQLKPEELMPCRYRELSQLTTQFLTRATESSKAYDIAKDGLQKLIEQITASFEEVNIQDAINIETPDVTNVDNQDATNVNTQGTTNEATPSNIPADFIGINPAEIRGIKPKVKTTKTSKRPKSCLEKTTGKRKPAPKTAKSKEKDNQDLNSTEPCLSGPGPEVPVKTRKKRKSASKPSEQDCNVTGTQPSLNSHLNQSSISETCEQPQVGTFYTSTNDEEFLGLMDIQAPQGTLMMTELLKTMDPNITDQQFSVVYNPTFYQAHDTCDSRDKILEKRRN